MKNPLIRVLQCCMLATAATTASAAVIDDSVAGFYTEANFWYSDIIGCMSEWEIGVLFYLGPFVAVGGLSWMLWAFLKN